MFGLSIPPMATPAVRAEWFGTVGVIALLGVWVLPDPVSTLLAGSWIQFLVGLMLILCGIELLWGFIRERRAGRNHMDYFTWSWMLILVGTVFAADVLR